MKKIRFNSNRIQSFFGFLGGLIFCALGVFIAIPKGGTKGIVWTGFAVLITLYNAINAFTKRSGKLIERIEINENHADEEYDNNDYDDSDEYDVDGVSEEYRDKDYEYRRNQTTDIAIQPEYDSEVRLIELKRLYDKKLITKSEYESKRKKIINGI